MRDTTIGVFCILWGFATLAQPIALDNLDSGRRYTVRYAEKTEPPAGTEASVVNPGLTPGPHATVTPF